MRTVQEEEGGNKAVALPPPAARIQSLGPRLKAFKEFEADKKAARATATKAIKPPSQPRGNSSVFRDRPVNIQRGPTKQAKPPSKAKPAKEGIMRRGIRGLFTKGGKGKKYEVSAFSDFDDIFKESNEDFEKNKGAYEAAWKSSSGSVPDNAAQGDEDEAMPEKKSKVLVFAPRKSADLDKENVVQSNRSNKVIHFKNGKSVSTSSPRVLQQTASFASAGTTNSYQTPQKLS